MQRIDHVAAAGALKRRAFVASAVATFVAGPLASCGGSGGENTTTGAGRWAVAGELRLGRTDPHALVLRDGRVLVLGGRSQQEIFDPATNQSAAAGTWARERIGFTVTMLGDGRVLVAGGIERLADGSLVLATTTLILDPVSLAWSAGANMARGRSGHTATTLPDGRVLVLGGDAGLANFSPDEIYDPVADTWSAAPPMTKRRADHTATLLRDGRVLVVAGRDSGDGSTSAALAGTKRVELFDPRSDTWSSAAPLPGAVRLAHTATLLQGGEVLVAGGIPELDLPYQFLGEAYRYVPANDTWIAAGRMATPRFGHRATLLADGKVLVGSGLTWAGGPALAEFYDPSANTWESTAPMVHPRTNFTVVGVPDGRGLAIGGGGGSETFESVEAWK